MNGLLTCIALHSRRIYLEGSHVKHPAAYHSPYSLFVPAHGASGTVLELGVEAPQGDFGSVFREFSDYVDEHADEGEYRQICTCVGAALENILAPNVTSADRAARAVELGASEGFHLLVKHLMDFADENPRGVSPKAIADFLLPGGTYGSSVLDDVAISALRAVSKLLNSFGK